MQPAPLPSNEDERLAALHALAVMDTPPEAEFDALVKAAAAVCPAHVRGTPLRLIPRRSLLIWSTPVSITS